MHFRAAVILQVTFIIIKKQDWKWYIFWYQTYTSMGQFGKWFFVSSFCKMSSFWPRGYSPVLKVWKLLLLLFFCHLCYTSSFCHHSFMWNMWIHSYIWIHSFMWNYENSKFCVKWCDFTLLGKIFWIHIIAFSYICIWNPKSRGHALKSIFSLVLEPRWIFIFTKYFFGGLLLESTRFENVRGMKTRRRLLHAVDPLHEVVQ